VVWIKIKTHTTNRPAAPSEVEEGLLDFHPRSGAADIPGRNWHKAGPLQSGTPAELRPHPGIANRIPTPPLSRPHPLLSLRPSPPAWTPPPAAPSTVRSSFFPWKPLVLPPSWSFLPRTRAAGTSGAKGEWGQQWGLDLERPAVTKATARREGCPGCREGRDVNVQGEGGDRCGALWVPEGGRDVLRRSPSFLSLSWFLPQLDIYFILAALLRLSASLDADGPFFLVVCFVLLKEPLGFDQRMLCYLTCERLDTELL
jgi:hypothetical protein